MTTPLKRLAGIADLFLTHNRPIHVRCDDSVVRIVDGEELPLRRSRGYAPQPIALPLECSTPILAVGGQLKGTFALGRGRHAFLSHHLGDLDHFDAYRAFVKDVGLYTNSSSTSSPRSWSTTCTRTTLQRGGEACWTGRAKPSVRLFAVQHHHAHLASCMAENGLNEPVIGVTFDGTGYGTDGARLGRRVPDRRLWRLPAGGASALRRHAGWRQGDPGTVADGARPSHGRAGRCTGPDREASDGGGANRDADAGIAFQHAANVEHGPALRCGCGVGGSARSGELRGASGHRAGMAGDDRGIGRPLSV